MTLSKKQTKSFRCLCRSLTRLNGVRTSVTFAVLCLTDVFHSLKKRQITESSKQHQTNVRYDANLTFLLRNDECHSYVNLCRVDRECCSKWSTCRMRWSVLFHYIGLVLASKRKSSSDNEISSSIRNTDTTNNNEEEDGYVQCSIETVYSSTEMTLSPPQGFYASQRTDNEYLRDVQQSFFSLKNEFERTKQIQHQSLLNYHDITLKMLRNIQQSNSENQQLIEQLRAEINNYIQDNEALKVGKFY